MRVKQLIQVDIDLARRADVADFETVRRETIFHQPGFLQRDPFLALVGHDEAGGRRPDMTDVAVSEIAALVDVAGSH